jgi:hypothetical protein
MSQTNARGFNLPPPMLALAGWLVPGAGYWLIGEGARAVVAGAAIIILYVLGLLIAGVRVIEVPGYGKHGYPLTIIARHSGGMAQYVIVDPANSTEAANPAPGVDDRVIGWALLQRPLSEIASKPWFVAQVLGGPMALLSAAASNSAASQGITRPHASMETVGTLYTAVAGMLNLLIIIDSTYRAGTRAAAEADE